VSRLARFIDLLIRVEGDPVDGLILRFDRLPAGLTQQLRLEGDARWLPGGRLQIGPGPTIIRGIPVRVERGRVLPVRGPSGLAVEVIAVRKPEARPVAAEGGRGPQRRLRLTIEQRVGTIVIDTTSRLYRFR
jgi:hypothetical protein